MTPQPPLSVPQVVAAIERELGRAPLSEPPPAPERGRARALQNRFRAEPVGGRLVALKRIVYWFVASSFDRQAKAVEALVEELEAESVQRAALERRLAELEARLAALEPGRPGSA